MLACVSTATKRLHGEPVSDLARCSPSVAKPGPPAMLGPASASLGDRRGSPRAASSGASSSRRSRCLLDRCSGSAVRDYYPTPLAIRGYAPAHRLLRPFGPVGQTFGLVGTVLMLVPFVYMARKRLKTSQAGRDGQGLARSPPLLRHRRAGARHVPHVVQVQRHHLGRVLVDGDRHAVRLRRPVSLRADSAIDSRQRADARGAGGASRRAARTASRRAGAADAVAATDRGVRARARCRRSTGHCRSPICCSASSRSAGKLARASAASSTRRRPSAGDVRGRRPADGRRARRCCGAQRTCSGRRSCSTCGTSFTCRSCTCCSSSRRRTSAWRSTWATCRFAGDRAGVTTDLDRWRRDRGDD